MAVAVFPGCAGASRVTAHPWMQAIRCSSFSSPSPCPPLPPHSSVEPSTTSPPSPESSSASSFFPKRGKTLELVCESLAFKGTGVCKVADTGFVVMCDRALPGERFIGRVSRKKGIYAEGLGCKLLAINGKGKQLENTLKRKSLLLMKGSALTEASVLENKAEFLTAIMSLMMKIDLQMQEFLIMQWSMKQKKS